MSEVTAARRVAFAAIRETFEDGAFTDVAFRRLAETEGLEGRDRAQAMRLAYGAVQRRGTSDALISRFGNRRSGSLDAPVLAALRLGFYEILFSEGTAPHAAVDQSVELVKNAGASHASGFVNALLRRAVREADAIDRRLRDDSTQSAAAIAHSAPEWLVKKWWEELGPEDARSLLATANLPAERALRINTLRLDPQAGLELLGEAGLDASPAPGPEPLDVPEMMVLAGSLAAAEPLIAQGLVTPQSRASAAVVALLDPRPGEQILDLCSGPGTKTGQIVARMGNHGEVISIESDSDRAAEVSEQADRLGIRSVTVIETDAAEFSFGDRFDRVLLDAPCSDLGALASRPDARWRKSPAMIERLVELQTRLLETAASSLRPGGTMVYSTCTISREENEEGVNALLDRSGQGDITALSADDLGARFPGLASAHDPRFLQIRPDRDGTTGFFIARLVRRR